MAVGRIIAALAVTGTVAPMAFLPPPLYSSPKTAVAYDPDLNTLSPTGLGGRARYKESCEICHGDRATGTPYGPALKVNGKPSSSQGRKLFHQSVTSDIPAHGRVFEDQPPAAEMGFNEIELIARYVRELSLEGQLR
jgi:mono/diheme cytochrome c family protein